jgi:soluble lytic murein transglycosylase-like protein
VRRWEPLILKYAAAYQLDPNLIAAIMMTESAGNPAAVSQRGAVGLMQVINGSSDPETNIQQGAQILANYLQRFGGDLELGLAAYNAGPNAVSRAGGIPPYLETQTYIFRVLNRYYLYSPG